MMSYQKLIRTTTKQKRLVDAVLKSPNPKDYLWGIVLTAVGENTNIPVESKAKVYTHITKKIEEKIRQNNDGEFILNDLMVRFAFVILERQLHFQELVKFIIEDDKEREAVINSYKRSKRLFPLSSPMKRGLRTKVE